MCLFIIILKLKLNLGQRLLYQMMQADGNLADQNTALSNLKTEIQGDYLHILQNSLNILRR
ncbi:MAG: hypothetical protein JWQ28_1703 [Pedobacter sp.]|nr:hypothetical protein [Pedobacter sp.]